MRFARSASLALLLLLVVTLQPARAADGGASIGGGASVDSGSAAVASEFAGGVAPDAAYRKAVAEAKARAKAKAKARAKAKAKARAKAKAKAEAEAKARAKAKAKAGKPKPKPKPKPPAPKPATSGFWFPLLGTNWSFGGDGAKFGAGRTGHTHQGQDIIAPDGTPIVSPTSGTVMQRANQPGGAGLYLVVLGTDGRSYVFMHLSPGSMLVNEGDKVKPRQHIADVGHTGDAQGSHLHFEIWTGVWYASGSKPIDPLPELKRWRHS